MGIGTGIVLIIIGLVLMFALKFNLPFVSDDVLGMILLVGGVVAIILTLVLNAQRSRTRHMQENRSDVPPPSA